MTRTERNRGGRVLAVAASLLFALGVSGATAQQDQSWLPWLGCWEPSGADAAAVTDDARPYVVCVRAADGGARFATIADGEVVAERTVIADGARHQVDQSGCTGWETADWSQDRQRVYLRSELGCEGGATRATSGVLTMATPDEWLDVQGVSAGGHEAIRVRRYREASESRIQAAGARPEPMQDRALALATARTAAAEPLSLSDVQEAASVLTPDVVGALLIERENQIHLDAETLRSLAEAGVSDEVIDLMVALANPDKFAIDRASLAATERPDEPRQRGERSYGAPYVMDYDPFWYGRYGYSAYDRYRYGYGYGWGYPGGYWYRTPRVIIVQPDNDAPPAPNGRYVKGRGYVPSNPPSRDGDASRGSRSGSGSSATSGSSSRSDPPSSSSGSSTGRTAKKRGGGSN